MTHKKNFVCAVKVNGKVLRESSDSVELPFGSEYSILLKNLDSVRVQARITIDGSEAIGWLVINPGQDIEIERFVKDLNRGNRFKFIELTERIENHRGIKIEDGLIRVEFKREKVHEIPKMVEHHTYHYNYPYWFNHSHPRYQLGRGSIMFSNSESASGSISNSLQGQQNINLASVSFARSSAKQVNDFVGITVAGSLSNQKFTTVNDFDTEPSEVIVIHLVGKKAEKIVKKAKTVHTLLQCETCGKISKSSAKFCKECGTSLEKV